MTADRDVSDAAELCRHLRVPRIGLVGMSQGARVAQALAAAHPELMACVVLDGAPGDVPDLPFAHYVELARTQDLGIWHIGASRQGSDAVSGRSHPRTATF